MKSLLLTLALLVPPGIARAAAPPELLCDPDAKITFQSRWLRASSVLLAGDPHWELPWTGKESVVKGKRLKDEAPEELSALEEETTFHVFQKSSGGPLETSLYIQSELLTGAEDDGLVIAETLVTVSMDPQAPPVPKLRVYHCRSR